MFFSHSDAMSYYAVLRYLKPKQVIEIGSGFSTLVAKESLDRNNNSGKILAIEPFPRDFLFDLEKVEVKQTIAQKIDPAWLDSKLDNGDVLFIDSTHTVKEGSDVIHIICSILPKLTKNIFVHFHDIFLPFSMPKEWVYGGRYWEEQYLLYAFLLENEHATVRYGSTVNHLLLGDEMSKFTVSDSVGGGSIWIELNGKKIIK